MNKPVLGLLAGGVLGAIDGLSALVSAPEVAPGLAVIVTGSMFKGLVAGVLIGWFARLRGPWFALGVIPWNLFYYLLSGVAVGIAARRNVPATCFIW